MQKKIIGTIATGPLVLLISAHTPGEEYNFEYNDKWPAIECKGGVWDAKTSKPVTDYESDFVGEKCYLGYYVAYDVNNKNPVWVLERIRPENINGVAKRAPKFKSDIIGTASTPNHEDYYNKDPEGTHSYLYARGHMAAAGNMKWNQKASDESFYTSNISPQVQWGFNNGEWKNLEELTRDMVRRHGEPVYVITGTIFEKKANMLNKKIAIPSHFYKIVYTHDKIAAFIMENKKYKAVSSINFINRSSDYKVSIDEIERKTGLNFFPWLSKGIEKNAESVIRSFN